MFLYTFRLWASLKNDAVNAMRTNVLAVIAEPELIQTKSQLLLKRYLMKSI